jgi:alkylated DNA repair dioxygenase AlkB
MKALRDAAQPKLFDAPQALPNGLIYKPDFLSLEEEEVLLAYLGNLPLTHPLYKDLYEAKRRHYGFGWGWNYRTQTLIPGEPLPRFLHSTQRKIAKWLQIAPERVAEALVNEYTPGSAIGWHVDNEGFEKIIGISLAGWCRMRFRPVKTAPMSPLRRDIPRSSAGTSAASPILSLEVEPRSAYIMQGPVRWEWQHSVAPVPALRYSITFRTLPSHVRLPKR